MSFISNRATRRDLFKTAGGAVALAALPLGGAMDAKAATPFSMGVSSLAVSSFPGWLIEPGGFDKKFGLDFSIVNMNGGNRGIQVLLSGHIQAMQVSFGAMVQANAQGADMRMIAASANTSAFTIFSTSKVTTGADLKGGAIGISAYGSETDIAATMALGALGLQPNDVRVVQLGGDAQRLAALSAGQVQAVALQEPAISKAKSMGFHVLIDLQASKLPYIFDGVVVTEDYIKSNRPALLSFLKAYVSAMYLGLKNPQLAKQVMGKAFNMNDPKIIEDTYESYTKLMPVDAMPSQAAAANVISLLQKNHLSVSSTNPSDYLDLSLLQELQSEDFFKQFQ